jgi:hypothetical protein
MERPRNNEAHPEQRVAGEREFDADLGAWLALVRDWLAAWRGAVRGPVGHEATPRIKMASSAYAGSMGGGGYAKGGIYLGGRRICRPSELHAAFAAASAGRSLPLEHQLIAEAIASSWAARPGQAVISACSAAEVALSGSYDKVLATAGRSEKERAEILASVSGVVELYRLNASRKRGLPISLRAVMHRLAHPRNRAVHAGDQPDEKTVRQAIEAATAILAVAPLPTPRQLLATLA